ncbi:MAG TPA: LytTR family DNA-binding domain-containing protein, partial [Sphingomonadales bacterium]|nr:LytTR family DNA-binding domain-containing protein [Sphingomonadales bacterium]
CIHVGEKTHILRATMKDLEKRLDPEKFQRVHRSAIVNMDKVKELKPHSNGEYFLFLEGGGQVKVSRSYKSVIARFL